MVRIPAARIEHLADRARAKLVDRFDHARPASPLRADLNDAIVLAGGSDRQLALARIVAARFLDVNVLAGPRSEDRRRSVPVVGRGDHERIDGRVVEYLAEVADAGRLPRLP